MTTGHAPNGWTMGVNSGLKPWANLTAVAILCLLAVAAFFILFWTLREERQMHREDLKAERESASKGFEKLGTAIDRNTDASRTVTEELRTLTRQIRTNGRSGYAEPEVIPFMPKTSPKAGRLTCGPGTDSSSFFRSCCCSPIRSSGH